MFRLPALLLAFAAIGPAAAAHEIKVFASRLAAPEPGGKATIFLAWIASVQVQSPATDADKNQFDTDRHTATLTLEVWP